MAQTKQTRFLRFARTLALVSGVSPAVACGGRAMHGALDATVAYDGHPVGVPPDWGPVHVDAAVESGDDRVVEAGDGADPSDGGDASDADDGATDTVADAEDPDAADASADGDGPPAAFDGAFIGVVEMPSQRNARLIPVGGPQPAPALPSGWWAAERA